MNEPRPRPRVAVVIQRYGEEVGGGAELHARWLAEHLLELADVEVITTCALDDTTWADHYPPGVAQLNGVTVHRFPVDQPRDWQHTARLTRHIVLGRPTLDEQLAWMRAQGPLSTPLLNHIRRRHAAVDAFIFVTYLYATTYFGLPAVRDKALLVPTAHDEPYLYLPLMRPLFHWPRAIAYNTDAERALVNRVTGNGGGPLEAVVGIGINEPADVDGDRFRRRYGVTGEFVLYIGRIAAAKNVPELFDHFLRYRAESGRPLQLVVGGRGHTPIPDHPAVIPLGFISEQDKFDAIAAAQTVVMPSKYESLSMIVLESWLGGKPVLVNGNCDVLRRQVGRSHGGLYYTSYAEFAAALDRLGDSAELRAQLGRQGAAFARRHYAWETIMAHYRALLDALRATPRPAGGPPGTAGGPLYPEMPPNAPE